MKFTSSFAALCVVLPLVTAMSVPEYNLVSRQRFGQGQKGGNKGGNNGNNGNNGANNNAAASSSSAAAAATSSAAAANNGGNNNNGGANNNGGNNNNDPQTSLTLDPKVIASGFANNGQDVPTAGQVASLTSTNNFINFCLTVPNLPLTNGQQITTGSCNPAPIGVIPSVDNMPSAKFANPANGGTVTANQAFTITLNIKNLEAGNFVNAKENYFAAPQQLNGAGQIIGHTHVVIEQLDSLTSTTPTDPKTFAFFKGINDAAKNGQVTADVSEGLPPAAYRVCTINSSSNHQPVIVPIAQHGSLDDCAYFTATEGGNAAGNAGSANNSTGTGNNNAGNANNAGNNAGNANNAGNNNSGAKGGNNAGNAGNNAGNAKGGAASATVSATATASAKGNQGAAATTTASAKGNQGAAATSTASKGNNGKNGAQGQQGGQQGQQGGRNGQQGGQQGGRNSQQAAAAAAKSAKGNRRSFAFRGRH